MATVSISDVNYDLVSIINASGGDSSVSTYNPDTNLLTVPTVSQSSLDSALTAFELTYDSLKAPRDSALAAIDKATNLAREKYTSSPVGQFEIYEAKASDAKKYKEGIDYPSAPATPTDYPYVNSEVIATGDTFQIAADRLLANNSAWHTFMALIEQHRITAKASINSAVDVSEIDSAKTSGLSAISSV